MENQIARWRESTGGLQRGFSPEQRRAAVALVKAGRKQGWSRSAVARGLGVSEHTLRIWERQKAALVPLRVAPWAVPEVRLLIGRMEARLDLEQLAQLVWRLW